MSAYEISHCFPRYICLVVVGAVLACTHDSRSRDVDINLEFGSQCLDRSQNEIVAAANSLAVAIDLECTGRIDSVFITRVGFLDALVVFRGPVSDTSTLNEESSGSIQSFGDLDGDGVLDVLLVEEDASSIMPRVFSLGPNATRELQFLLPQEVASLQVLRDFEHPTECVINALPRLELDSFQRVVVSAVPLQSPSLNCEQITRIQFTESQGRLVSVHGESSQSELVP